MKFYKKALIAALFVFVLAAALFLLTKKPQIEPEKVIRAEDITVDLQNGDIICRLGDRLWSRYFRDISLFDKRFSHAGIIRVNGEKITVINAEGLAAEGRDFVNEVDLDEFLSIARAAGVYRVNDNGGEIIASKAVRYKGRPFDWHFDLEDENELYCSELLYAVLKETHPEIQLKKIYLGEIKKEVIPIEAFSDSRYFSEIFYAAAE
jgi:hypothetical protein